MSFWDVDKVYPTACRWQGKGKIDPGRTVDDLARGASDTPAPPRQQAQASRARRLPRQVPQLVGAEHDRLRAVRAGLLRELDGERLDDRPLAAGPGQVDRLWILNVDGQRLVVDAS
jgi:hypothetical protein